MDKDMERYMALAEETFADELPEGGADEYLYGDDELYGDEDLYGDDYLYGEGEGDYADEYGEAVGVAGRGQGVVDKLFPSTSLSHMYEKNVKPFGVKIQWGVDPAGDYASDPIKDDIIVYLFDGFNEGPKGVSKILRASDGADITDQILGPTAIHNGFSITTTVPGISYARLVKERVNEPVLVPLIRLHSFALDDNNNIIDGSDINLNFNHQIVKIDSTGFKIDDTIDITSQLPIVLRQPGMMEFKIAKDGGFILDGKTAHVVTVAKKSILIIYYYGVTKFSPSAVATGRPGLTVQPPQVITKQPVRIPFGGVRRPPAIGRGLPPGLRPRR